MDLCQPGLGLRLNPTVICYNAGDMVPEFQRDMLLFLQWMLKQLDGVLEDSRLCSAAVGCINAFLLRNGLDIFSKLGALHEGH